MDVSLSLSPGELDRVNELRKRDALISVLVEEGPDEFGLFDEAHAGVG